MSSSQTALIDLSGIGKTYPVISSSATRLRTFLDLLLGRAVKGQFTALADINLVIRPGESWGIIGENGAGKSTLMKIVAGVVKPSSGEKKISGRVNALLELGTGFHPEYSGRENIFLAASLMGWTEAETRQRIDSILEFADIDDHIDLPVKTYSSGMVVRLGFAVATALTPDLLVTDEVLAVGDESFQKKCLRWMEGYLSSGGTLMFCSHSMYHIQSLCQKAIWIHHGRARMLGDVHQVTQAYLAYHEEKNKRAENDRNAAHTGAVYPVMQKLSIFATDGSSRNHFSLGEDIVVDGLYHAPDDKPTVLMVGIMRIDGTPVHGTFSPGRIPLGNRLEKGIFGFRFVLKKNPLLPGKYVVKAHTLDEHGLRLFDTMQSEITIEGETPDHGLVRLEHEWLEQHEQSARDR